MRPIEAGQGKRSLGCHVSWVEARKGQIKVSQNEMTQGVQNLSKAPPNKLFKLPELQFF